MQPPTIDLLQPTETLGDVTNNPVISTNQLGPVSVSSHPHSVTRSNTVGHVTIHGQPIVSLVIDAKERLCLAQISTTLLKGFSYNEIHNRRVALGITCVQCTPVQLEILRRAGAMPVSSRRCGMITRREAERLVRSFLDDVGPPRLPDDFAFEVRHACGWGCRGSFIPSRYNSSRAKCIKCTFCAVFFSPNKFIFHFHRTPDATYNHPDAANFNSWRRHLFLADSTDEHLQHAWEDVKAMFNGGSRKREVPHTSHSKSYTPSPSLKSPPPAPVQTSPSEKRPKMESGHERSSAAHLSTSGMVPSPHVSQFSYPLFPVANRVLPAHHLPAPYALALHTDKDDTLRPAPFPVWPTQPKPICPSYESLWAKHLGIGSETPYLTSVSVKIGTHSMTDCNVNIGMMKTPEQSVEQKGSLLQKDYTYTSAFKRVGVWNPASDAVESHSRVAISPCQLQAVRYYGDKPMIDKSDNESESDNEHVDVDTVCDNEPSTEHHDKTDSVLEINNNNSNRDTCHNMDLQNETPGSSDMPPTPVIDSHRQLPSNESPGYCYDHGCNVHLQVSSQVDRLEPLAKAVPCPHEVEDHTDHIRAPEPRVTMLKPLLKSNPVPVTPQEPSFCDYTHEDNPIPNSKDEEIRSEPTMYNNSTRSVMNYESPRDKSDGMCTSDHRQNVEMTSEEYRSSPPLTVPVANNEESITVPETPTPPPVEAEERRDDTQQDGELSKDELLRRLNMALSARQKLEEDCRVLTDTLFRKLNEEREVRQNLQQKLNEAHATLHNLPDKPLVPHNECADCRVLDQPVSE